MKLPASVLLLVEKVVQEKTEAAKLILNYISAASGKSTEHVQYIKKASAMAHYYAQSNCFILRLLIAGHSLGDFGK